MLFKLHREINKLVLIDHLVYWGNNLKLYSLKDIWNMFKYHLLVSLELERKEMEGKGKIENDFYMHFLYNGINVLFRILLR